MAELRADYSEVFETGLGKCAKAKAHFKLKEGASPVFRKSRPVPYASLPKLEGELSRLVENGVITPVSYSEFAAPVVVVKKKTGDIRLCADHSTGLNDTLEDHHHPLPTAEDIYTKLNGGIYFSNIDLAEAYLQIEVAEECRKMLCINTPKGLFQYNRLSFGVKTAPATFQQMMDTMIAGLPNTAAYLDDIVVTGETLEDHNGSLRRLFDRIKEYGLRVRLEKCSFLKSEIRFLGQIINKDGRKPDQGEIEAIVKMPAPTNVSELRALLGMVTYYGAFMPAMRDLRAPLTRLL